MLISVACAIVAPTNSPAHHSANAAYNMESVVEIEGEVLDVAWRNPHILITLAAGQGDERTIWDLETGAVNTVQRLGVTIDDIRVGDRIRVAGSPGRQNPSSLFVSNALLIDGREVFLLPAATLRWQSEAANSSEISAVQIAEADRIADGLFRVWTRMLSIPPSIDVVLTEKALEEKRSWDPERDDPTLRCEAPGMVEAMVTPSPIELARDGDDIVIRMEEWDQMRSVSMSTAEGLGSIPASALGLSTGRWDGDVLVVSTTNIDWPYFDDSGTPQSGNVTIEERFSMSADESRMTWEAVISDPEYLARPATVVEEYVWVPGERIRPYNCTL